MKIKNLVACELIASHASLLQISEVLIHDLPVRVVCELVVASHGDHASPCQISGVKQL